MPDIQSLTLPQIITAVGGLGTAAFGLVDSTKALGGGVNHIGFEGIKKAVTPLTSEAPVNALSRAKILNTLQANWFNGNDMASQKAIAKSLIKLNLGTANASALAAATGVDPAILTVIAAKISSATPLDVTESDTYARFDMIVTAILDEAYQRASHKYTSATRFLAMVFAVLLAMAAGIMLDGSFDKWLNQDLGVSVLVGLLATPLAPVAKDLSSALAAAVNAMQRVNKK